MYYFNNAPGNVNIWSQQRNSYKFNFEKKRFSDQILFSEFDDNIYQNEVFCYIISGLFIKLNAIPQILYEYKIKN